MRQGRRLVFKMSCGTASQDHASLMMQDMSSNTPQTRCPPHNPQEAAKGTTRRINLGGIQGLSSTPIDVDIPAGIDSGQTIQVHCWPPARWFAATVGLLPPHAGLAQVCRTALCADKPLRDRSGQGAAC